MRIALDYDDTFTLDKQFWIGIVGTALHRGHEVSFVTSRCGQWDDNEDIETDAKMMGIPIVYCSGQPKSKFFKADVWIDDYPAAIPHTSSGGIILTSDIGE